MVEARGIGPLSENTSVKTSPGADGYFGSPRFPYRDASRHASRFGSFIVHGTLKALRTHVLH